MQNTQADAEVKPLVLPQLPTTTTTPHNSFRASGGERKDVFIGQRKLGRNVLKNSVTLSFISLPVIFFLLPAACRAFKVITHMHKKISFVLAKETFRTEVHIHPFQPTHFWDRLLRQY